MSLGRLISAPEGGRSTFETSSCSSRNCMMSLVKSIVACALVLAIQHAWAHHSFAAEYDRTKMVVLDGVVTKIEWENPHTWLYLDVKGEDGRLVSWAVEAANPSALIHAGWHKDSLKPGDKVKVQAYAAKNGGNTANARSVTLPDGKRVFAGSSDQLFFPPPSPPLAQPQK
jgi:hypothetical protein